MIYVISDLHLNHNQPFIYEPRGFTNVHDMTETLIDNYNEIITDKDIVYILGDCVLNSTPNEAVNYMCRLHGTKYLAIGNHDTEAKVTAYQAARVFKDIQLGYRLKYKKASFYLTHHPLLVANASFERTYNIHGHDHSPIHYDPEQRFCYSACVDSTHNSPISLSQIYEDIKTCACW